MTEFDTQRARFNMIEQQIRPWEVLDQRVLEVMLELPRHAFVEERYQTLAYSDLELPIGHGRMALPPRVEARMAQALALQPADEVLEIGIGNGYTAALLARLAGHVDSVDPDAAIVNKAARNVEQVGITNVTFHHGDVFGDWTPNKPYDAIVLTGSMPVYTGEFRNWLRNGGRLFVIVGEAPVMEAWLHTKVDEQTWQEKSLFDTVVPPLPGAPQPRHFSL